MLCVWRLRSWLERRDNSLFLFFLSSQWPRLGPIASIQRIKSQRDLTNHCKELLIFNVRIKVHGVKRMALERFPFESRHFDCCFSSFMDHSTL